MTQCTAVATEEWRLVVGYEDYYEVSSLGRVKRVCSYPHHRFGRILKPRKATNGYYRVYLSKDSIKQDHLVHKLVAAAFLGERPEDYIREMRSLKGSITYQEMAGNFEVCPMTAWKAANGKLWKHVS